MTRLLLFLTGVGAGNATRNLAILEELHRIDKTVDIHIAAQGTALTLLAKHYETHRMQNVTYSSGGKFSMINIIRSNLGFPIRFLENRHRAAKLMRSLKPDLIVADSDFYCLGPARQMNIPLISINNSAAVIAHLNRFGTPADCKFSARFIERTDYYLQRRYPRQVICPVLSPVEGIDEKFRQIPPIVRPDFHERATNIGPAVVVVTGGSGIGAQEIDLRNVTVPVHTYGTILNLVPAHTEQRGFNLDDATPMRKAKVLVVQGGFSSISEAMALGRPTVVVPIARHAEQYVNAQIFQRLGLGLSARGPEAGNAVNQLLMNNNQLRASPPPSAATDGAEQAARIILENL